MIASVAGRFAELALRVADGEYEDFRRMVVAQGGQWTDREHDAPIVHAANGITVGIPAPGGDPVTCYVQVALALIGPMWALIPDVQNGMTLAMEEWSKRTRAAKAARSAEVRA